MEPEDGDQRVTAYALEQGDVWHIITIDDGRSATGLCGHAFAPVMRRSSADPDRVCHGCLWRQQRAAPPTQE